MYLDYIHTFPNSFQIRPYLTVPQFSHSLFFLDSPVTPSLCSSWVWSHSLEYGPPTRNHTPKTTDPPSPEATNCPVVQLRVWTYEPYPLQASVLTGLIVFGSRVMHPTRIAVLFILLHVTRFHPLRLNILPCTYTFLFYAVICQWTSTGCSRFWLDVLL